METPTKIIDTAASIIPQVYNENTLVHSAMKKRI